MFHIQQIKQLNNSLLIKLAILLFVIVSLIFYTKHLNKETGVDNSETLTDNVEVTNFNKSQFETNISLSPTKIKPWPVRRNEQNYPINPMDINKPLPTPKICVNNGNVDEFLKNITSYHQEAFKYLSQLNTTSPLIKWSSIISLNNPELINHKMMFHFMSDNEDKYFLDFVQRNESECNIITLGIGHDFGGEVSLWNRYPQCKFTGVDPKSEINKDIVERVPNARFFQATIGAQDGNYSAFLKHLDRHYETVTIQHIGISKFLNKINGNKLIDLMIMDIEGAEFGVLEVLVDEKKSLPVICQLNVELHYPMEQFKFGEPIEDSLRKLEKFWADGTFVILNIQTEGRQIKLFAINTVNKKCIKKFLC